MQVLYSDLYLNITRKKKPKNSFKTAQINIFVQPHHSQQPCFCQQWAAIFAKKAMINSLYTTTKQETASRVYVQPNKQ